MDDKRLDESAEYYGARDISTAELEHSPGHQVVAVTSFRIPKPLMDRVRDSAADEGIKPSALVRRRVELGLVQHESTTRQKPASLERLSELMHRVVREELEEAGLR